MAIFRRIKKFSSAVRRRAYFDYAATTPLEQPVREAMWPFLTEAFGNASSVHGYGRKALAAVDAARTQVAALLACSPHDVLFTSGATESNNLLLFGLLKSGDHLIISAIEHAAVLEPARILEQRGVAVSYLAPDSDGVLSTEAVLAAVGPATRVVSIQYVNNEIGTIQPIAEIGKQIQALNKERQRQGLRPICLHTDAVQAACWLPLDVRALGVDALSLSAHKMYGPKGIGILYRKHGVSLTPLHYGGHQEYGLRPGTLPVAQIVGMGAAATLQTMRTASQVAAVERLREHLFSELRKLFPGLVLNGSATKRVAGNLHLTFPGLDAQDLFIFLDQHDIAVSTGPACAAGSATHSHVLTALGASEQAQAASLRITLGHQTSAADVEYFLSVARAFRS